VTAEIDTPTEQSPWFVEISPPEVDAGAEFTVRCQVEVPPGRNHGDLGVSIRSLDDAELAFAELTQSEDGIYVTDEIPLDAPLTEGEHVLRAVLVAPEQAGTPHDEISTGFAFVVKAHAMRLTVWGLPTAIVAGEYFTFKVGIKCSCGCDLAGREVSIVNGEGIQVVAGSLHDDVWPGTSALYFAEVEGHAPLTVGNQTWEARFPPAGSGIPHSAGALAFAVQVVDPPDCDVTVEAFDAASQTPISNARIVMQPYRALTGQNGIAALKVVKGTYKLLVSATKYSAIARTVEVTENLTVRAELALDPPDDPVSQYAT
jgi:hypothetical protein